MHETVSYSCITYIQYPRFCFTSILTTNAAIKTSQPPHSRHLLLFFFPSVPQSCSCMTLTSAQFFLTHSFHFIEHVTDELISENRRFKYLRHPNCAVIRRYWSICVQPCSWRASSNTYFEWYNLNIKIQWGSSDLILGSLSLSS